MTYTVHEKFYVTSVHKVLGCVEDRCHEFDSLKKARAFINKANSNEKFKESLCYYVNDRKSKVLRVEKDITKTTEISIFSRETIR